MLFPEFVAKLAAGIIPSEMNGEIQVERRGGRMWKLAGKRYKYKHKKITCTSSFALLPSVFLFRTTHTGHFSECDIARMLEGIFFNLCTNVHSDSRMNSFDFGGQTSLHPHLLWALPTVGLPFSFEGLLETTSQFLKFCLNPPLSRSATQQRLKQSQLAEWTPAFTVVPQTSL